MKFLAVISACFAIFGQVVLVPDETPIYWKEFNGTAPEDAIVASNSAGKEKRYIGSVPIEGIGLCIGTLVEGINSITIEGWNSTTQEIEVLTKNYSIGILCTIVPDENLPWKIVNSESVADMKDDLVDGGFEADIDYIGRIKQDDNEYTVGRIVFNYHKFGNCLLYTDGKSALSANEFEVLLYHRTT